ncbi:MAG: hypothetical protein WD472_08150 [Dehalococcoidia bacterium]
MLIYSGPRRKATDFPRMDARLTTLRTLLRQQILSGTLSAEEPLTPHSLARSWQVPEKLARAALVALRDEELVSFKDGVARPYGNAQTNLSRQEPHTATSGAPDRHGG